MATDDICIKKSQPCRVRPAAQPSSWSEGHSITHLSNIDQLFTMFVSVVFCYRSPEVGNETVAAVLKRALAEVLVHYYPLAGRLVRSRGSEGRRLDVVECECQGGAGGVEFVEAEADCEMEEIGQLAPNPEAFGWLVGHIPKLEDDPVDIPLLQVQVTRFRCGGFTLGIIFNHRSFDGAAMVSFLQSWTETARGLPLSTKPLLDRTILKARNPPRPDATHLDLDINHHAIGTDIAFKDMFPNTPTRYASLRFGARRMRQLKREADSSTFEALTGLVWRAWTAALGLRGDQTTRLAVVVDARQRMDPPLPWEYFGNAVVTVCSDCRAGELVRNPLAFAAGLVHKATSDVDDGYIRSFVDFAEVHKSAELSFLGPTLIISSWRRLGFVELDFGWGNPMQYGPVGITVEKIVFMYPNCDKEGSVRVAIALPAPAMRMFREFVLRPSTKGLNGAPLHGISML